MMVRYKRDELVWIMLRAMPKLVTMSEVLRDQVLEKLKDLKEFQNSKHCWGEASIYCNLEVRSVASPLIKDRKSPKEMVSWQCFRP